MCFLFFCGCAVSVSVALVSERINLLFIFCLFVFCFSAFFFLRASEGCIDRNGKSRKEGRKEGKKEQCICLSITLQLSI